MGKNPAFQFYPGDWRRDTQVQMASMATRGVWIEMLCCMWDAPERGELSGTILSLSRLIGCSTDELTNALLELRDLRIADVTMSQNVTDCHSHVTVISRRMQREEKAKNNSKLRKRKQRESQPCPTEVTLPSSSSSSVPPNGGTPPTPSNAVSAEVENDPPEPLPDPVPVPTFIPYETWQKYKYWRSQEKRRPVTIFEEQLAFEQLRKLGEDGGQDLEAMILQSMSSDWTKGFYPVRGMPVGGAAGGMPRAVTVRDAERLASGQMARHLLAKRQSEEQEATHGAVDKNGGRRGDGCLEYPVQETIRAG